jgi:hypothetical protein
MNGSLGVTGHPRFETFHITMTLRRITMRYRIRARAARLLAIPTAAALLGGLAVVPAHAGPRLAFGSWQSYLEQPATGSVRAVAATVLSGSVTSRVRPP